MSRFSFHLPSLSRNRFLFYRRLNIKKTLPLLIIVLSAALVLFWFGRALQKAFTSPRTQGDTAAGRVTIAGPRATQSINSDFSFPLTGANKKVLTEVKFSLESAELRDEIIVKGQRATAIEGRAFVILTIKITSGFNRGLEINSRDYFRLTVNDNEGELLAPEIHNDPVTVQPKSTKYTRLGFPVNETDRNLRLIIGEIEGEKTVIDLTLL